MVATGTWQRSSKRRPSLLAARVQAPAPARGKGLLDNYDDAEGYYNFQVGYLAGSFSLFRVWRCMTAGLMGEAAAAAGMHSCCSPNAALPTAASPSHRAGGRGDW